MSTYWENRFYNASGFGQHSLVRESWPNDPGMRILECSELDSALTDLQNHIPGLLKPRLLELGCGVGGWVMEVPEVHKHIQHDFKYLGVDSSMTAITFSLSRLPVSVVDIRSKRAMEAVLNGFKPDIIVARRVLQNLSEHEQRGLLEQLPDSAYCFFLETTCDGLSRLNRLRRKNGLSSIHSPEFNTPLSWRVVRAMDQKWDMEERYPFKEYYRSTRVDKPLGRLANPEEVGIVRTMRGFRYSTTPQIGEAAITLRPVVKV